MKRLLFIVLLVFLLVDIFLAVYLLKPESISWVKPSANSNGVEVTSSIPNTEVKLSNPSFLDKKLNELGFWKEGRVRFYDKDSVRRVTVRSLILNITEKPQPWGQRADSKSGEVILYSYGQTFDSKTGVMTILIHLNSSFQPSLPLSQKYSGVVLFALFDLAQSYPITDQVQYSYAARSFLNDLRISPLKNSFVKIDKP